MDPLVLWFKNAIKIQLSLWNRGVEKRTAAHVGELKSLQMGSGLTLPLTTVPEFPLP